jgi:tripartite-type tricarboxylate transporter receptor subunit TctC
MSGSDAEITWEASATKTFAGAQTRETIVGSAGPTSQGSIVPRITNAILGTRFKIVEGYKGTSDLALAMLRGEIEGMNFSLQNLPALHPEWIAEKKVQVLWLQALERDPAFPDVPTLTELAKDDGQRALLTFVTSDAAIGRSLAAPPGVPEATIALLRAAFDAMAGDGDFVADAAKRKLPLRPATGQRVQDWIKATMATSPETIERLKAISTGG